MNDIGHFIIPLILVLFIVYRRVKRSIGFQRFHPRRLKFRIGIFTVIGLLLLCVGFVHPILYVADALGLICGTALVLLAIRHLKFEQRGQDLYYRTHIGIETTVVALFIARLAYRLLFVFSAEQTATVSDQSQLQQYGGDPWTSAIFFILITYYISFYLFLLQKGNVRKP